MIVIHLRQCRPTGDFLALFLGQFFLSVSPFFVRFAPSTILVHLITTNNATQKFKRSGIPKYGNFLYLPPSLCFALTVFIAFCG
jgi:hypothetical protein